MFFILCKHSCAGHGGSDGLHAYVNSLDDAVTDMVQFELHSDFRYIEIQHEHIERTNYINLFL